MIVVARLAMLVGLAGLVPFVLGAGAVVFWTSHSAIMAHYFYLYCAGILAFMAGIYWPIGMQLENRSYPVSPVVTLVLSQVFFVAGGLGLLLPLAWQAVLYPLLYVGLYLMDVKMLRSYWPAWYLKLRLLLTGVSIVSQLVVAGVVFTLL